MYLLNKIIHLWETKEEVSFASTYSISLKCPVTLAAGHFHMQLEMSHPMKMN